MAAIPLEVYLSWPKPNYVDPVTRGQGMLIVSCVLLPLSFGSVCLRVYRKAIQVRQFGWDDALIVAAAIFTIGFTIPLIIANNRYALNRHVWDIPATNISSLLKYGYAAKLTMHLAGSCTRMSLVCFYFRLIQGSNGPRLLWILRISLAVLIFHTIFILFAAVFACAPVQAYWAFPRIEGAKCLKEGAWSLGAGITNCLMDVLVTTLPIPIVMKLSMTLRKRVVVIILLNLGLLATAAGCVRTYFTWRSLIHSYDTTWEGYGLWIAGAVEVNIGVFCACVPTLRFLFGQWFGPITSNLASRMNGRLTELRTRLPGNSSNKHSELRSTDSRDIGHGGILVESEVDQSTCDKSYSAISSGNKSPVWEKTVTSISEEVEDNRVKIESSPWRDPRA